MFSLFSLFGLFLDSRCCAAADLAHLANPVRFCSSYKSSSQSYFALYLRALTFSCPRGLPLMSKIVLVLNRVNSIKSLLGVNGLRKIVF